MKKLNINEIYVDINIMKVKHTCDKPIMVGMGLMGMGTGMVPGTEKCIITHTHNTHTCIPTRYIHTHGHYYCKLLITICLANTLKFIVVRILEIQELVKNSIFSN